MSCRKNNFFFSDLVRAILAFSLIKVLISGSKLTVDSGFQKSKRIICCCCSAYLSSCHRTASDAKILDDPHTFHYNDYFVIGGIRTCLGVSDDPMFLSIFSNSCPLNLLLVRSHPAEIIIVKKRLIQGLNNVTRVRIELTPFDQVVVRTTPLPIRPCCRHFLRVLEDGVRCLICVLTVVT